MFGINRSKCTKNTFAAALRRICWNAAIFKKKYRLLEVCLRRIRIKKFGVRRIGLGKDVYFFGKKPGFDLY